jgi:hypothetical protein
MPASLQVVYRHTDIMHPKNKSLLIDTKEMGFLLEAQDTLNI